MPFCFPVAEAEQQFNAVERLDHYARHIEQEAPARIPDQTPPSDWPSQGAIHFDSVSMRYRSGLPTVLHGLSFSIKGGERIGFVGRTGAGKSSILVALLRLAELSGGRIVVDGVDVSAIGLHDLRSKIA